MSVSLRLLLLLLLLCSVRSHSTASVDARILVPLAQYEVDHNHIYWNPHVDKANIASYDYSALLYLNSQGEDFDGGDFAFLDLDDDVIIAPMKGRLLTFTSGLENLHQVREVTRGTRTVLAMWFTCSKEHVYKESD